MARKYKLTGICLFTIITILLIFTFTASAATQVTLRPLSKVVESGSPITVDIFVDPDTEIAGMQFDLKFDGSVLQVTDVTEGDLFKQNGTETFFNPGQKDTGTLKNVYGCILGKGEASTSARFATVTLSSTPGKRGVAQIYLQNVTVSSREGNAVQTRVKNTSIILTKTRNYDNFQRELIKRLVEELTLKRQSYA
ncbi:cohesin domain-containing protein [Methanosarcina siciliae]|uniref:cohesin domain-containing protein n=1 Tax=Methanosarcina siciliae TaxID=38027 RepID=UPI00064EF0F2|nr:cohesin domain-containing protein [Methanosarcina siciliae]